MHEEAFSRGRPAGGRGSGRGLARIGQRQVGRRHPCRSRATPGGRPVGRRPDERREDARRRPDLRHGSQGSALQPAERDQRGQCRAVILEFYTTAAYNTPIAYIDSFLLTNGDQYRQAHAVALFYLEDYSVRDIAAVLDCSEGTVKTHLSRARSAVARQLRLERGEEDHD